MEWPAVWNFSNDIYAAGSALRLFQRGERMVDRASRRESCLLCVGIYRELDFSKRAQIWQTRVGFCRRMRRDHRGLDGVLHQPSLLSFPLVTQDAGMSILRQMSVERVQRLPCDRFLRVVEYPFL